MTMINILTVKLKTSALITEIELSTQKRVLSTRSTLSKLNLVSFSMHQ